MGSVCLKHRQHRLHTVWPVSKILNTEDTHQQTLFLLFYCVQSRRDALLSCCLGSLFGAIKAIIEKRSYTICN